MRQVLPGTSRNGAKPMGKISQSSPKTNMARLSEWKLRKIMLIENSDNQVISIYDMCILGPSLYTIQIYIIHEKKHTCGTFAISSISHQRCFPAVDVNGRPKPPDLVIMVQRQSVSYALKLCILESEVPEEILRTNHDTRRSCFCQENSP